MLTRPVPVLKLPPDEHDHKHFPFGKLDIICLHVASQHRGIDFSEIDFVFGGSTLEMLAQRDPLGGFKGRNTSDTSYLAMRLPGFKTIMIVKNSTYTSDYAKLPHQFERLMTGKDMDDTRSVRTTDHLQIMQIGVYRVLFRAETDAIDSEGRSVEIKTYGPQSRRTKTMFQMMSSGSMKLCYCAHSNDRTRINQIKVISLQEVAQRSLASRSELEHVATLRRLQENIVDGMDSISQQVEQESTTNKVFEIGFDKDGMLNLQYNKFAKILPVDSIVTELTEMG